MRRLVIAFAFGAIAMQASPQEGPAPAIQGMIRSQINAFVMDDFATAFTFASPSIGGLFGDPDRFGRIVRQGNARVWRPRSVAFGALREVAGARRQRGMVTDALGGVHGLDHQMFPARKAGMSTRCNSPDAPGRDLTAPACGCGRNG